MEAALGGRDAVLRGVWSFVDKALGGRISSIGGEGTGGSVTLAELL